MTAALVALSPARGMIAPACAALGVSRATVLRRRARLARPPSPPAPRQKPARALSPAQQHDVRQSDVLAFPLNPALAAGVGAIDLCSALSSQPPALLVLETGQEGSGRRLANAAGAQGARADYRRVDEAKVWMREPYEAVAPLATMAMLVSWMEEVAL